MVTQLSILFLITISLSLNLINHSKKEISLVRGLDKEAAKLVGRLGTLQEFLNDAESLTIPGRAVKSWLKNLEDVAFDADNIMDELNYHLLSKKIRSIKPMKKRILSCFSSFNHISRPRNIALKIQEINENLESIQIHADSLGLKERLATEVSTLVDAGFETDAFTNDPIFIGRDDVVSKIVEILTGSVTSDERLLSIIVIVGMGGLGKTTFTRNVFNCQKEQAHFGSHIWLHVSQIFDPIVLLKKILIELNPDKVEPQMSKQDIMKKLEEALKDKKYLLILDDVWNKDVSKWEYFINSMFGVTSAKGSAIIATTRSTEVASIMSPHHTHNLKGLSEEDCWSIIKEKSFGKEDIPLEFEAIGRRIAGRCQGLPLAANVVGGVLRNKSDEKWHSIEEKWLSHDEGDHITKILSLSFDNLPRPSLKKCFAYCSIFSKGYNIEKQKLIEYWMAEGFLESDGGDDEMELLGDKFVNVLLHNSLLQVAERDDYGNVEMCVMHDLVHDLACLVLSSKNIGGMSRVRYMIHHEESNPIPKEVAKYVRTLLFEGSISGEMFADFECLHVLDLCSYEVGDLPFSIRKLIHLRKLDISLTNIKYLPDWIGELHQLQTLNAYSTELVELPSTLKYLINLRHLYIRETVKLAPEIGRLTLLQTLTNFVVGDKDGYKLAELGSLNGLKGELKISSLERVDNKEEAEKASLSKKSKLLKLCLTWDQNREGESTNDENVLEGLQPHSDLKKLEIKAFKGKRFPSWTQNMAVENVSQGSWVPLNKLIEIKLSYCSECEEIPMFGQLPNLKSLMLNGLINVRSISSAVYGLVNEETRIVFPALESLELHEMPNLVEWADVELGDASDVKVFPQLRYLKIQNCKQLTSFPNHSSTCINGLIISKIGSYKALADIFQTKLTLLIDVILEGIDDLERLPDWLFYNNPYLSKLYIFSCYNLRELPGLGTLSSLKWLAIDGCPSLERIGDRSGEQSQSQSQSQPQGSLCYLGISNCNTLVYFPCEMLQSSLEELLLENLSSLQNLPNVIDCLPKLCLVLQT